MDLSIAPCTRLPTTRLAARIRETRDGPQSLNCMLECRLVDELTATLPQLPLDSLAAPSTHRTQHQLARGLQLDARTQSPVCFNVVLRIAVRSEEKSGRN